MLLRIITAEVIPVPTTTEKAEPITMNIKSNELKNKIKLHCFCNLSVLSMKVNWVY